MNLLNDFTITDDAVDKLIQVDSSYLYTHPGVIPNLGNLYDVAYSLDHYCKLKNKKIIAFCDYKEAPNSHFLNALRVVTQILENDYNFKPQQFIYISGYVPVESNYAKISATLKQFDLQNIQHKNIFYWENEWNDVLQKTKLNLDSNPTKKFLFFGASPRPHRLLTIASLIDNHVLENSIYSILQPKQHLVEHCERYQFYKARNIVKQSNLEFPQYLDMDPTEHHIMHSLIDSTIDYYKNSVISIISETSFYNNNSTNENIWNYHLNYTFVTEKTMRAIACCHPFIVTSRPYTLAHLQELGYKTFHPFIDESYDTIEDDHARIATIHEIIKELNSYSLEQLNELKKSLFPVLTHNQNLLRRVKDR